MVDGIENIYLVNAPAGSGKTTWIRRQVEKHLLENEDDNILCITYTNRAAEELGKDIDSKRVFFGTIHSFISNYIGSFFEHKAIIDLYWELYKEKIAQRIDNVDNQETVAESNARYIEKYGTLDLETVYSNLKNISYGETQFTSLYYGSLSHDDLLSFTKKVVERYPVILKKIRDKYQLVFIDEYQDINPIQYELIHLLTHEKQNLFVVGDDDQAIYGFRGSDGECFQKFLSDYKEIKTIYLNINYRCVNNIVKASKVLISKNQKRIKKDIVSGVNTNAEGRIDLVESVNTQEPYKKLADEFLDMGPLSLKEEAVLFRTNAALQSFANYLAGKRIPFIIREKIQSYYEHFIASDIMDYYMAANGCRDRALYLRVFQKAKIAVPREILKEEQVDLEIIKKRLLNSFYKDGLIVQQIELLERHFVRLGKMRPRLGITYILHAMNYERYLLSKAGNQSIIPDEWKEVLAWIQEDVVSFVDFKSWIQHVNECKETFDNHIRYNKQNKCGIHLMTMHGAKGLEFQKVYILHLNDGVIPKLKKGETVSEELIEEERRLFYVAITRAKLAIELHYVVGTKESPRLKSRFLDEIGF